MVFQIPLVKKKTVDGANLVDGVVLRGPNWARNKKNRDQQKARKHRIDYDGGRWKSKIVEEKKKESLNWRERSAGVGIEAKGGLPLVARTGFFSDCDDFTQKALRESRAQKLIAENKWHAAQSQAKLDRLETPEAIVGELIRVSKMVMTLEAQTKDKKIGGWAKTVGESLTRSVAESAPSSVPSLESVGYDVSFGESALKSADGKMEEIDAEKEMTRIRYEMALRGVERKYAQLESYNMVDERNDIRDVKKMYASVAYTEAERIEMSVVDKISDAMGKNGLGNHVVSNVFQTADVMYHCEEWN